MKKPTKPTLTASGVASLNAAIGKRSTMSIPMEGSDKGSPVISIPDLIELLQEISVKYKDRNPVIISSKRSLYIGGLMTREYKDLCAEYGIQLAKYKEKRKRSLLAQLKALEEDNEAT